MSKRTCKWCGKEYEMTKSGANNKLSYCGKKCESDAKGK